MHVFINWANVNRAIGLVCECGCGHTMWLCWCIQSEWYHQNKIDWSSNNLTPTPLHISYHSMLFTLFRSSVCISDYVYWLYVGASDNAYVESHCTGWTWCIWIFNGVVHQNFNWFSRFIFCTLCPTESQTMNATKHESKSQRAIHNFEKRKYFLRKKYVFNRHEVPVMLRLVLPLNFNVQDEYSFGNVNKDTISLFMASCKCVILARILCHSKKTFLSSYDKFLYFLWFSFYFIFPIFWCFCPE